ncbi:MAG: S24 family peptidase [Cyanobacteriota bacterium]|nr:S24 family peptidase [Cyanobacteriota bacterium]
MRPQDQGVSRHGAPPDALTTGSGESRQASGFPSPALDYEEGRIDLNRELVASPLSTFLMRVRGDAMGADGISDGDLLVIDRALQAGPGCLVVAMWEGRFIVRRLSFGPDGRQRPRLEASDGVSAPIPLDDGLGAGADLWGVVRHAVHGLDPCSWKGLGGGKNLRKPEDGRREP